MAGPKLASPSYFTLYFTLARVILLGQEIDFKSPFLRLTAPRHPPFPGPLPSLPRCKALLPLTPSSTSSGPTHTHTALLHTGDPTVPSSMYGCTFTTGSTCGTGTGLKGWGPGRGSQLQETGPLILGTCLEAVSWPPTRRVDQLFQEEHGNRLGCGGLCTLRTSGLS